MYKHFSQCLYSLPMSMERDFFPEDILQDDSNVLELFLKVHLVEQCTSFQTVFHILFLTNYIHLQQYHHL